jgi:pimeloyl-ACP methyl ester carboxylesterase
MPTLSPYPVMETALPDGSVITFRQSRGTGAGTVVLLHGIGSNSASWTAQLAHGLGAGRVLAWNAPGYGGTSGDSTAVAPLRPAAQDYAAKLWQWLDALGIKDVALVGHSLGCIIAARATALQPQRVSRLTLLSPAQGYATATEADREQKRSDRLNTLGTLGVQGMAEKRSSAMLSANATAEQKATVQALMGSINVAGYTQAVHLLMDADIGSDLSTAPQVNARVACGTADSITPPAGCAALAARFNLPYTDITGAGHAIAVEAPDALNTYLSK